MPKTKTKTPLRSQADHVFLMFGRPPSVNHIARHGKNGSYTPPPVQEWKDAAEAAVLEQRPGGVAGKYICRVYGVPPDYRKRDIDNINKALKDALERHGVVEGDHLCHALESVKDPVAIGGYVVLEVVPYDESLLSDGLRALIKAQRGE